MSYNLAPYDPYETMFCTFWDENGGMLPWARDFEALNIYECMKVSHNKMITLLRHTNNFRAIVDEYNSHQLIQDFPDRCKFIPHLTVYAEIKDNPIARD